jgi:23S rRNA (cytosine1962-C5)-methyltransferase
MIKSAASWKDFEILASGGGEKLERWGGVLLLRPDPQAIWRPRFDFSRFAGLNARYLRSDTGGGRWQTIKKFPEEWTISWTNPINSRELKFLISPTGFKHTGLFPEQAVNWERVTEIIKMSESKNLPQGSGGITTRPLEILNLFGYTGGATVAAAAAGARVTHVDAAKGMVEVCRRNVALNNLPADSVRYIVDDCAKFVAREIRRGKTYDAIIMDPPSFGRGANGEVWKIEAHLEPLVELCTQVLRRPKPLFFLINSYTTGLQPTVLKNVLQRCLEKGKICGNLDAYEIGIRTKEGIDLPAGCSCIAEF